MGFKSPRGRAMTTPSGAELRPVFFAPGGDACQDYLVPLKAIHELWAMGKMSHDSARHTLITSRCIGADKLHKFIDWTESCELNIHTTSHAEILKQKLEGTLDTFRSHPKILEWQRQFEAASKDRALRFMPLLLQGQSQSGKTRKAISLWGHARTMVVNCQGLQNHLPSLKEFDPQRHSCILFDEVNSRQVLSNKMVFQAGVDPVTLGQSACNAHSYKVWLHAVPMMLCSNDFQMEDRPGQRMAAEDVEWLVANICDASLPPGQPWYFPRAAAGLDDYDPASDECDADLPFGDDCCSLPTLSQ
jgi:hypothetical protein